MAKQNSMSKFVNQPRVIEKRGVPERFEAPGRVDIPLETLERAAEEASRCVNGGCGDPGCQTSGCPKHHDIPGRHEDIVAAQDLIEQAKALPEDHIRRELLLTRAAEKLRSAFKRTEKPEDPYSGTGAMGVYARYCPQDGTEDNTLCGPNCTTEKSGHGRVAIPEEERFIEDNAWENVGEYEDGRPKWKSRWHAHYTDKSLDARAGVIGLGNGGADAIEGLLKHGFRTVIGFDRFSRPGGTFENMVPMTKTDGSWVFARWFDHHIEHSGLQIELGTDIGEASIYKAAIGFHELINKHDLDVIIICTGATRDKPVRTLKEGAEHVIPASAALQFQSDLDHGIIRSAEDHEKYAGGNVVDVIGIGDTGMDLSRTGLRQIITRAKKLGQGAKVRVHYYKGEEDARTSRAELDYAKEEGVEFIFHSSVTDVIPQPGGTFELITEIEGQRATLKSDRVFSATGFEPEFLNRRFQLAALGEDIGQWHRMIVPPPMFDRARNPHGLRRQANDLRILHKAGYLGKTTKANGKHCKVFVGGDWQEASLGILAAAGSRKAANMAFQAITNPDQFARNTTTYWEFENHRAARELESLRHGDNDKAIERVQRMIDHRNRFLTTDENGILGLNLNI